MATPKLRLDLTDVGAGADAVSQTDAELSSRGDAAVGALPGALPGALAGALQGAGAESPTKMLKPLPHAVVDYAWAATMLAAPWLFGFSGDRKAKTNAVASGAAILGLSLLTRYPLGAAKLIPFPVHGAIEAAAGAMTAASPWLMGFSRNRSAKWTHLVAGLGTLAVVAVTDYRAAEQPEGSWAVNVPEGE